MSDSNRSNSSSSSSSSSLEDYLPQFKNGDAVGDYIVRGYIGKGLSSTVWKVSKESDIKTEMFALKAYTTKDKDLIHYSQRELENYKKCACQESSYTVDFIKDLAINEAKFLVLPLAQGDLFHFLRERGPMRPHTAHVAFKHVLKGVEHLHSRNLAHGDIKPENILVFISEGKWTLKLSDFDSVLQYDESGVTKDQSHCSHDYRPPELLLEDKYYLRSDMWSVGCLFYEMVTAESLFDVDDDYDSDYTGGEYDNGDEYDNVDKSINVESSIPPAVEKSTPIPIPVSPVPAVPAVPISADNSLMSSSESEEDDDDDDEVLEHLAQMIEILGPVPKAFTKRYREWFTKRGYLRACRVGFQKGITRLLKDEDIGNREAAEWSSIISPLLSYAYKQRPTASETIKHRFLDSWPDIDCVPLGSGCR